MLSASEGRCFYKDPFKHLVIIGGTGGGKTSLMHRIINSVDGAVIVLSPDGDLAERIAGDHYITKSSPISLNPLTLDYLEDTEKANIVTETLNTASKVATEDKQMPMMVLMQKILRNAVRIGVADFKKLVELLEYEDKRKAVNDKYWKEFDRKDSKGWLVDREQVESARRVAARLSWLTDDPNAYQFLKGKNIFSVDRLTRNKEKYIFNFARFDPFVRSFLGGLIMLYIRSYYTHQATTQSPPLYVFVDEVHRFVSDSYYHLFAECRKYNISFNITLHTYEQISDKVAALVEANCHTKVSLKDKFKAEVEIGEKKYNIKLYQPDEYTPPEDLNFLKQDTWIAC
jgi:type IV secretory pathway VirB4 component